MCRRTWRGPKRAPPFQAVLDAVIVLYTTCQIANWGVALPSRLQPLAVRYGVLTLASVSYA